MTDDRSSLPLRPAVGIAVFSHDGRVFVGRRLRGQVGTWQMPQGGIDDGETPLGAALRELEEETGIVDILVLGEIPEWLTYELPTDAPYTPRWASRYRGQAQRWFAVRYLGEDAAIDLRTEHPEFDAWRWVTLAEACELVVAFKRPVYDRVAEAFEVYAQRVDDQGPTDP
jgi:putative (di)nucleoside polyphosphate hydrolase